MLELNMKVKGIYNNVITGTIYDMTSTTVWIENEEDIFKTSIESVQEIKEEVKNEVRLNKVASAKLEFSSVLKDEYSNVHRRFFTAYITVTSKNEDDNSKIESIFDELVDKVVANCNYDIQVDGCPTIEYNSYCDGITLEYEHGSMTDIKKDIREAFKQSKKEMGL